MRVDDKKKRKSFGRNFISLIGFIIISYLIIPRIANILKQVKRNRNYNAKRDTVGLLGNFEKQSIRDKYK